MNQYATMSVEEQEELLSNYLVEHWSVSSVRSFIRNEKDFEREYIFKDRTSLRGLSAIIGGCYHKALMEWFKVYREDKTQTGFDRLVMFAYDELDRIPANVYKVTEKVSIFDMQKEALERLNYLLTNFIAEVDSYLDEIEEILFIEEMIYEFVTLDGIDIPLPLKMIPDIVFINKKGELCIIDHKAKRTYTNSADIHISCSQQSVAYSCGVREKLLRPEYASLNKKYPKLKDGVKWFYYYENKFTKNRDGKRQIKRIDINMNESARVYEAVLFEGVIRMLQAVNNPDYVYLMNADDNFANKEELFDFWAKNRIEGLDAFPNLSEKQKNILNSRRKDLRRARISKIPKGAVRAFKQQIGFVSFNNNQDMSNLSTQEKIEHRLRTFSVMVTVAHTVEGYACDSYLLEVGAGTQFSSIIKHKMDIANSISVDDVRIAKNLIQYKDGSYLSVEVKKLERKTLTLNPKDVSKDTAFKLGKDNFQNEMVWDIGNPSTPHMLISGASGSGKSITLKAIIEQALIKGMSVSILDPKFEFLELKGRKKVSVLNEKEEIEMFMENKVKEMDAAYKKGKKLNELIIFDEANDLLVRQTKERKVEQVIGLNKDYDPDMAAVMEARGKKYEVPEFRTKTVKDETFQTLKENTMILAQKSRSAGIHLVLASQRFSVKVLDGDAKANFTARLCLTVAAKIDSMVMLDEEGAEKLNGKGDALYRSPEMANPVRIQTYFFNK